ncbi:MAG TPA: CHAT domain-containing tetratricopeptide repeat protein [Pyrinomonadaceae bacterium]|nr:CHAT domain-containing tetratricopeptide repeat protein [Pyrinomonadaceae bacterium]
MSFTVRLVLCILTLSFFYPDVAKSQAVPNSGAAELVALVRAKSPAEQERMLAERKELVSSSAVNSLKELVNDATLRGDYPEAMRIAQLELKMAERLSDKLALGVALSEVGNVYSRQNRPTDALDNLQKSLAIFEELGNKQEKARALHSIGFAYGLQRRYDLAVEVHSTSLAISEEIGDKKLAALCLNSLGLDQTTLGRYQLGLELYQKARVLSEQIGDKATLNLSLNNIATHYISQGRYAEALDFLLKSLKVMDEMGGAADRRSYSYKLQNIGLVYRHQGDLDQALSYSRRSLAILEEIGDQSGIANLQNNIGVIYKSQKQYEQALEWLQKSFNAYQSLKATPGIARTLNNIGDVYRLQGRYDEALPALQKSLELREANRDRGGIALTLNNLGRLYQAQGKYAEMLAVGRRSASIAEEINAREELWDAQERIGRALSALGQTAEAQQSFLASIATVEKMRREVAGGEQQQQSFMENKLTPWLGLIDLLVAQGKNSEALAFAEQSKARVLLDALQRGRATLRQSLSPSEREAEEQQRLGLVSLNSQLNAEVKREKSDAAKVAALRTKIEKARLEYEDFETRLYVAHPELKIQRGEAPVINAAELDSLVPDKSTALLEYVVAEDKTYLFTVTRSAVDSPAAVRVYTIAAKREELAKQTETLRLQLAARDLGFRASAAKLYDALLKPAGADLRARTNLVIAADNILWDLPFQALISDANRYVIESAAVSYAPSFTVLREMTKRRNSQPASANLLALGNPSLDQETIRKVSFTRRDEKLEPLPEAEQEVKTLGRLYGSSRSQVYIGADAREDLVKSEAGQAKILHFATHGVLNNVSPMYSHLVLAEGGPNEDGLLEAWELMQLDLHADLAVLSACETARGRIGAGEGLIGLSWAMFIAGVPSLVVSQWKVDSASTRDLMVNFHRGLLTPSTATKVRLTKTEALRQASLKVMKNPQTSHPFYWAGFVLIGDER